MTAFNATTYECIHCIKPIKFSPNHILPLSHLFLLIQLSIVFPFFLSNRKWSINFDKFGRSIFAEIAFWYMIKLVRIFTPKSATQTVSDELLKIRPNSVRFWEQICTGTNTFNWIRFEFVKFTTRQMYWVQPSTLNIDTCNFSKDLSGIFFEVHSHATQVNYGKRFVTHRKRIHRCLH